MTVSAEYSTIGAIAYNASFFAETWTLADPEEPAFTLQRQVYGSVTGGDYARGSAGNFLTTPKAALRFGPKEYAPEDIATKFNLVTELTDDKAVRISWGWPHAFSQWDSLAVVKAGFGFPVTVNDGTTVIRSTRQSWVFKDDSPVSIQITDDRVQPGRWVYYTLFFHDGGRWYEASRSSILVPRDFQHSEHLWNMVPPHHQYLDDMFHPNNGYLRQFLKIFGAELDQTREFVESWQHTYDIDSSPVALLRHVGENFGIPYEAGLGDIRYRGILSDITNLYSERGTMSGVQNLVRRSSKYECYLTSGPNMLPMNDDSEFVTGSGNWGRFPGNLDVSDGIYCSVGTSEVSVEIYTPLVQKNDIVPTGAVDYKVSPVDATLDVQVEIFTAVFNGTPVNANIATPTINAYNATVQEFASSLILDYQILPDDPPTNAGRYALRVNTIKSEQSQKIILSCGYGLRGDGVNMVPKENAISIRPKYIYGFQAYFNGSQPAMAVRAGIAWFSSSERLVGISLGEPSPLNDPWSFVLLQTESPTGAQYAVPYIVCSNRVGTSPGTPAAPFMLMGCMFYLLGSAEFIVPASPDNFLTLGQEDEYIGNDETVPVGVDPETLKPIG